MLSSSFLGTHLNFAFGSEGGRITAPVGSAPFARRP